MKRFNKMIEKRMAKVNGGGHASAFTNAVFGVDDRSQKF